MNQRFANVSKNNVDPNVKNKNTFPLEVILKITNTVFFETENHSLYQSHRPFSQGGSFFIGLLRGGSKGRGFPNIP